MKIFNDSKTPIVLTTLIIFLIDFIMPPGSAIGVLYLIPMTIAFKQKQKIVTMFAIICSLLIIVDGILFYEYSHYSHYIDRAVSIIAIWLSSFVVLRYRAMRIKNEEQKKKHLKTIIELLFITSHKMRRPISTLQGLKAVSKLDNLSGTDVKKVFRFVEESVADIDVFTKELTGYLVNLKESEEFEVDAESEELTIEIKTMKQDFSRLAVLKSEAFN